MFDEPGFQSRRQENRTIMTIPRLTKSQLKTFMRNPANAFLALVLLSIAAATPPLATARQNAGDGPEAGAHEHEHHAPAKLVEIVRQGLGERTPPAHSWTGIRA